jgi:predicted nucleotidyltransferase
MVDIETLNVLNVPSEQMQQYILTAKSRQKKRLADLEQRRLHGFEIAKTAAQILKTEFSASRVVVFGSLLSESFHETSDLDLAVWSLPEKSYFKAVARLLSLSDFEVDLVEVQYASPEILDAIAQGTEL